MNNNINLIQIFGQFKQNPMQFISRQYNLPQNVGNNPQQIVQYLLDSGQINQQMVNRAQQMMPQFNQMFGGKK